ncbi:MAG: hypothetical protein WCJ35_01395 [Planctomycetota bacterium]
MPRTSSPLQCPTDNLTSPVRSRRDGGQCVVASLFDGYLSTIRHPHDEATLFIDAFSGTVQILKAHDH